MTSPAARAPGFLVPYLAPAYDAPWRCPRRDSGINLATCARSRPLADTRVTLVEYSRDISASSRRARRRPGRAERAERGTARKRREFRVIGNGSDRPARIFVVRSEIRSCATRVRGRCGSSRADSRTDFLSATHPSFPSPLPCPSRITPDRARVACDDSLRARRRCGGQFPGFDE